MSIRVETRFQPAREDGIPAIALQVMILVNSYMIWAGATGEADVENAVNAGRLVVDWACAMPSVSVWWTFSIGIILTQSSRGFIRTEMRQPRLCTALRA